MGMNTHEMQAMKLLEHEYATKDLYFAAFLHLKQIPILRLEQYGRDVRGQKPVYFIFDQKERCEELEGIFWNGTGEEVLINVKDFTTTVRDLRARAFSVSRAVSRAESNLSEE